MNYDSYGKITGDSSNNTVAHAMGYTGQVLDTDANLDYFKARYYDPRTGRFMNVDPAGVGTNLYEYAKDNPITNSDPTGLSSWVASAASAVGNFISPGFGSVVGGLINAAQGFASNSSGISFANSVSSAWSGVSGAVSAGWALAGYEVQTQNTYQPVSVNSFNLNKAPQTSFTPFGGGSSGPSLDMTIPRFNPVQESRPGSMPGQGYSVETWSDGTTHYIATEGLEIGQEGRLGMNGWEPRNTIHLGNDMSSMQYMVDGTLNLVGGKALGKLGKFVGGLIWGGEAVATPIVDEGINVAKRTAAEILAANRAAGKAAEVTVEKQLIAEGNKILGSQVTVQTSAGTRVIDHLIQTPSGDIIAAEVKSGNAARNAAQLAKDSAMATEGARAVGKNAPASFQGAIIKIETIERRVP